MANKQKNITLDEDTMAMLDELERKQALSASALIRQYIRDAFREMRRRELEEGDILAIKRPA